jgi:hypothetical protein
MNNNETLSEATISSTKGPKSPNIPQQSLQLPSELQQQISILNARINNANLAHADLLKEMDSTFKAMATTILALHKENAELKDNLKEN